MAMPQDTIIRDNIEQEFGDADNEISGNEPADAMNEMDVAVPAVRDPSGSPESNQTDAKRRSWTHVLDAKRSLDVLALGLV